VPQRVLTQSALHFYNHGRLHSSLNYLNRVQVARKWHSKSRLQNERSVKNDEIQAQHQAKGEAQ
jgi:hypothetical protein